MRDDYFFADSPVFFCHVNLLSRLKSVYKLQNNKCGKPVCFQPASLLASGLRPISAVVIADFSSICEKISCPCWLEPLIASFKFNRS